MRSSWEYLTLGKNALAMPSLSPSAINTLQGASSMATAITARTFPLFNNEQDTVAQQKDMA